MKRFHVSMLLSLVAGLAVTALMQAGPKPPPPPPPPKVKWEGFGDADVVNTRDKNHKNVVQLTSDYQGGTYAGIFYTPKKPLTFDKLTTLSTDVNVIEGTFGGGSPRFTLVLDIDGTPTTVHIYVGTPPQFDDDPAGWQNTGNLIGGTDLRWDLTHLGGPFYGSYADAVDMIGDAQILEIDLIVDSGWLFGPDGAQVIQFDNINLNGNTFNGNDIHYNDDKFPGDLGDR